MKNLFLTFAAIFSLNVLSSQIIYKDIASNKLGETRQIKIQLPRGYDNNTNKTYPLIMVFDGDYLFEPVAGNVDYYSYWEDMPASIVVGINQFNKQQEDCYVSEENFLPIESGSHFFEFVGMELLPYLNQNYRTANFRVAVGHGQTANYINYYLLKGNPLFQAYISLSPNLEPQMEQYIAERLPQIETKIFYYLATGQNDLKGNREAAEVLNINLSSLDKDNFHYMFNNFDGTSHYSLVTHSIPNALELIFSIFQPISKEEYKDVILTLDYSPVEYLKEKYEAIDKLFNIDKKILVNDFRAIAACIEKNQWYEYFEDLGKLAREEYPDTILGSYYTARYYEEMGEPKKAYKTYKSAYVLDEIAGITKDLMLEKAEQLKVDFGF